MNPRLPLMAVMVALLCACGGGGSPSPSDTGQGSTGSKSTPGGTLGYDAPANLDACKLLTAADAAKILSGTVSASATTRTKCSYGSNTGHFVGLELAGAILFDPGRKALKATNQQVEDVSGLGDAAYYNLSGGDATLFVKKSGAQLMIQEGVTGGNQESVDQKKAAEKQVAVLALSRM